MLNIDALTLNRVHRRRTFWTEAQGRPDQLLPPEPWNQCYKMGGRGSGKTRAGAEGLAELIILQPYSEGDWAIIAPTFADARDTCVEGPSGMLRTLAGYVDKWNRSQGQLKLVDGSTLFCDGADDGARRIQGKNLRGAWCDEVGLWRTPKLETSQIGGQDRVMAWDESLLPVVRMAPGKIICTGTPKGRRGLLVRRLLDDPKVPVSTMRTIDNAANLSKDAVDALLAMYQGSHLGRQELEGQYVEDVEGAWWKETMISRMPEAGPMGRVVVGVDPAGSVHTETGIVAAGVTSGLCVCGGGNLPHAYVLGDWSIAATPDGWARSVVQAFDETSADRVVAERNYGGDMVEKVIRSVRPGLPFGFVTASRGKMLRAEPVAALYEQQRVHHVGVFFDLESEMTTYTADAPWSPNRLDAMVWAVTELGLHKHAEATISSRSAERTI